MVAKTISMVEITLKSSVVNKIPEADSIGSGLNQDFTHIGTSYLNREQLMDGKVFTIKRGDGIERKLLQAERSFNDKESVIEYIHDNKGNITHQRFIKSNSIKQELYFIYQLVFCLCGLLIALILLYFYNLVPSCCKD